MVTDWSYLEQLEIENQFSEFVAKIHEYMDICAPVKTAKIPYKFAIQNKWMTSGLLRSSRHLCKLRRKMSAQRDDSDPVCKYKAYRNLFNRVIRLAKSQYYGALFENHKGDICATWHTLNDIIGKTRDKTSCTSMNIDVVLTNDPAVISNTFCDYFTKVGHNCAAEIPAAKAPFTHHLRNARAHSHSFFLDPITPGEIISIISQMKGKSSSGHDNISSKLIKSLKGEIAFLLSILINNSLVNGIVPASMKIAKVLPLYKAKDRQLLSNYRPISLLPTLSKVLEKVVHNKLCRFLKLHDILFESQYGFRKHHSTIHGVAEFIQHAVNSYDDNKCTISVLLDLSKAFDTINHRMLLYKLKYYGIRGIAYQWFHSYLSNRIQYVTFNGTKSIVQIVTCGVPQGSVLGPLLFLIYMNDLPLCLKASKAILFADDTTLYASSDDIAHLYKTVNHDLENLTDWFRANKLSLNTNKTHYMLFSHNRQLYPPDQYTIQIESNIIDRKNCCKFLGLLIDDKLTWSEHIAYVHSKLSKSLYAMNRSKYLIPSQYLKTLYDSLVQSYLSYGVVHIHHI